MKEILMIFFLVIINIISSAQSLKGFTLGEKLVGSTMKLTTVAGIKGGVGVETLKDGTIAMILFMPSTSNGEKVKRISEVELNRLKNGIEENYNVSFTKEEEDYSENFTYLALDLNDNTVYSIKVDYDEFFDEPYEISFAITNKRMMVMREKEQQEKANSDF